MLWAPRKIPVPILDRLESGRFDAQMWGTDPGPNGFFDIANRYAGLDAKNDPLARIDEVIRWATFRPRLETVWRLQPDFSGRPIESPKTIA